MRCDLKSHEISAFRYSHPSWQRRSLWAKTNTPPLLSDVLPVVLSALGLVVQKSTKRDAVSIVREFNSATNDGGIDPVKLRPFDDVKVLLGLVSQQLQQTHTAETNGKGAMSEQNGVELRSMSLHRNDNAAEKLPFMTQERAISREFHRKTALSAFEALFSSHVAFSFSEMVRYLKKEGLCGYPCGWVPLRAGGSSALVKKRSGHKAHFPVLCIAGRMGRWAVHLY